MSGDAQEVVGKLTGIANPSRGTPAPLTQEQINELIAGRTTPEVAALLRSHPGFVKVEGAVEASVERPAPFTLEQVQAIAAGKLSGEKVAALLRDVGSPRIEVGVPIGDDKRAPIELSAEELAEAAKGVTPKTVAARFPQKVDGEDISVPEPVSRPSEPPPDVL